jgi:hypothetical protein
MRSISRDLLFYCYGFSSTALERLIKEWHAFPKIEVSWWWSQIIRKNYCWKNIIFLLEEKSNITRQTRSLFKLIRKMSEDMDYLFKEQNAGMMHSFPGHPKRLYLWFYNAGSSLLSFPYYSCPLRRRSVLQRAWDGIQLSIRQSLSNSERMRRVWWLFRGGE